VIKGKELEAKLARVQKSHIDVNGTIQSIERTLNDFNSPPRSGASAKIAQDSRKQFTPEEMRIIERSTREIQTHRAQPALGSVPPVTLPNPRSVF